MYNILKIIIVNGKAIDDDEVLLKIKFLTI